MFQQVGDSKLGSNTHSSRPSTTSQDIDNLPASEARRRLEAFRKRQQAAKSAAAAAGGEDGGVSGGGGGDAAAVAAAAAARGAFEGAISEAFEGALKFYVSEEQKEVRWRFTFAPPHPALKRSVV